MDGGLATAMPTTLDVASLILDAAAGAQRGSSVFARVLTPNADSALTTAAPTAVHVASPSQTTLPVHQETASAVQFTR